MVLPVSSAAAASATPPPGVRLLPSGSGLRERVERVGHALGLPLVEGEGPCELLLVDLEAPGAAEALAQVLGGRAPGQVPPSAPAHVVLALGHLGDSPLPLSGVDDVVDVGALERELPVRLSLARARRARLLARDAGVFAHVQEGVAILDAQARLVSLNPVGARMLEVEPHDVHGRHINQVWQPADAELLVELVWRAARGEPTQEVDVVARTPGGRHLTLSLSAGPLPDGSLAQGGGAALFSFRDVTTQRQLADELRHTKEFLERLIDSSVDAIIAADMEGRVILFNKGAEAICGYAAAEVVGKLDVEGLYPPGVAREVMRRLRAPGEGGPGRLSVCRQEILTRAGERVPVNMTASILYEGGREVATVGIFTDLRDRVQLERQLSDAQTRLEQSEKNAVIVALAGTAAHELNQPLTSVMGYAELLKRRLRADDPSFRPVDIIYREAERMAEIVRKIGKITRYETKAYIGAAQILDLDKATSREE